MQLTPLRGRKISAILLRILGYNRVALYRCGAANAHSLAGFYNAFASNKRIRSAGAAHGWLSGAESRSGRRHNTRNSALCNRIPAPFYTPLNGY